MQKKESVAASLVDTTLKAAAKCVREGVSKTRTYTRFPMAHWRRIRTNNAIERLNREIRRRMRMVGNFPNGRKRTYAYHRPSPTTSGARGGIWTYRYWTSDHADD